MPYFVGLKIPSDGKRKFPIRSSSSCLSVRQLDSLPAVVIEVLAISIGGLGHFDDARSAILLALLAFGGFCAAHEVGHDDVKLFIGRRFELAVLHDVGDLRRDALAEGVVIGD